MVLGRLKGGASTLTSQIIVSAGNFLGVIIPSKFLNKEEFGSYLLAIALVLSMSSILTALVHNPIRVRAVALSDTFEQFASTHAFFLTVLSAIVLPVGAAFALLFLELKTEATLSALVCCAAMQITDFERALYAARHDWHTILRIDLAVQGLRVITLSLLATLGALNVPLALCVYAISSLIAPLIVPRTWNLTFSWRRSLRDDAVDAWRYGQWLFYEAIVFLISTQLYVFMCGKMLSHSDAGSLGAIQQLVNVANIFQLGVIAFVTPIARQALVNTNYQSWARWNVRTAALLFVTISILMWVAVQYRDALLTLIYTEEVAKNSDIMIPLSIAAVLLGLNSVWATAFRTAHKPKAGFIAKGCAALFTIFAAYPLISKFGLWGAASGLLVTQIVWFFIYFFTAFGPSGLRSNQIPWREIATGKLQE